MLYYDKKSYIKLLVKKFFFCCCLTQGSDTSWEFYEENVPMQMGSVRSSGQLRHFSVINRKRRAPSVVLPPCIKWWDTLFLSFIQSDLETRARPSQIYLLHLSHENDDGFVFIEGNISQMVSLRRLLTSPRNITNSLEISSKFLSCVQN